MHSLACGLTGPLDLKNTVLTEWKRQFWTISSWQIEVTYSNNINLPSDDSNLACEEPFIHFLCLNAFTAF